MTEPLPPAPDAPETPKKARKSLLPKAGAIEAEPAEAELAEAELAEVDCAQDQSAAAQPVEADIRQRRGADARGEGLCHPPVHFARRSQRSAHRPARVHPRPRLRRHRRQALRLGMSNEPPQTLKSAADEAVSGARPDLLDRNGEILATDVKTMSVFAEPRRIIDKDEAVELITAVLPDVDARDLRERLSSKKGFIWIKRQVTPKEQRGDLPSRPARRRLRAGKQARLSQWPDRRACHRLCRQGQYRHRRDGEISRRAEPHRSARAGLRDRPRAAEAGAAVDRSEGDAGFARRTRAGARAVPRQGGGGRHHRRQHRRSDRAGIAARLRSQRSRRHEGPVEDQPDQRRRL